MRHRTRPDGRIRSCAALLAATLAGCGPTAPVVTVVAPLPRGEDPVIAVTAARQRDAILHALIAAGFTISDRPHTTAYLLRVTLGVDQGARPCGSLNNVRYSLRRDQHTIVEVVAKGWSGACEPSVFTDASRALRQRIVQMTGIGGLP